MNTLERRYFINKILNVMENSEESILFSISQNEHDTTLGFTTHANDLSVIKNFTIYADDTVDDAYDVYEQIKYVLEGGNKNV